MFRAERMREIISEKHQVSNVILNRWKLKKKKGGKKRGEKEMGGMKKEKDGGRKTGGEE